MLNIIIYSITGLLIYLMTEYFIRNKIIEIKNDFGYGLILIMSTILWPIMILYYFIIIVCILGVGIIKGIQKTGKVYQSYLEGK